MIALRNLLIAFALLFVGLVPAEAASRFAVCAVTCTWDGSSTVMWSATTGGTTGASVPGASDTVTFDANTCVGGVTCTTTVNTNFSIISLTTGACTASTTGCVIDFSANNNSPTVQTVSVTGTGTRSLNCGTGTWTFTGTSGTVWTAATSTNMTFTCASAPFTFTATTASARTFSGGGLSYNVVTVSTNSSRGTFVVSGGNTFSNLALAAGTSVTFGNSTVTITNAVTWTGTAALPIMVIGQNGGSFGVAITFSLGAAGTCSWCMLGGLGATGAGSLNANNSFNVAGPNTGSITITAPSASGGGGALIGG